jgi:argininosuccinate lyase
MTGIISTLIVNEARMRDGIEGSLVVAVELAETLVTESGLNFREAYKVSAALVRQVLEEDTTLSDLTPTDIDSKAREILGKRVKIDHEHLDQATDPETCLMRRRSEGSPHPENTWKMLRERTNIVGKLKDLLEAEAARLLKAMDNLKHVVKEYISG